MEVNIISIFKLKLRLYVNFLPQIRIWYYISLRDIQTKNTFKLNADMILHTWQILRKFWSSVAKTKFLLLL